MDGVVEMMSGSKNILASMPKGPRPHHYRVPKGASAEDVARFCTLGLRLIVCPSLERDKVLMQSMHL